MQLLLALFHVFLGVERQRRLEAGGNVERGEQLLGPEWAQPVVRPQLLARRFAAGAGGRCRQLVDARATNQLDEALEIVAMAAEIGGEGVENLGRHRSVGAPEIIERLDEAAAE